MLVRTAFMLMKVFEFDPKKRLNLSIDSNYLRIISLTIITDVQMICLMLNPWNNILINYLTSAACPHVVANPKKLTFIFFSILHLRIIDSWIDGPFPNDRTPWSQLNQNVRDSSLDKICGVLFVSKWTEYPAKHKCFYYYN